LIPTGLAAAALAALLAGACVLLWQGAPWLFVAGAALASGAPLVFVLDQLRAARSLEGHPLVVSILSGLGCVLVMIASQRFGAGHDWALYLAVAALSIWMIWQRGQRRKQEPPRT
jgi:hypothetical protein